MLRVFAHAGDQFLRVVLALDVTEFQIELDTLKALHQRQYSGVTLNKAQKTIIAQMHCGIHAHGMGAEILYPRKAGEARRPGSGAQQQNRPFRKRVIFG